ncbi:SRPBCC family protein [Ramlibacter tataouinensis]|uniref:SRPBCC family protein n=1 Tax=Ramlibacter tataouinensis TaxID=94132 RepID=UPI0022F39C39|nr:SRPBCC family protein [Ramlibacter tataouinensis]WBY01780.1 SRPBCC family protein [Ramlibacter tataouinensis]
MRANLPTIAALAAGGLLLSNRMRQHHHQETSFEGGHEDGWTDGHVHEGRHHAGTLLAAAAAVAVGGLLLSSRMRAGEHGYSLSTIEESVDLAVPVRTAYNQWTQFEQFPRFMASVHEVRQIDDTHLHWKAVVAGKTKEWDAEITEQIPDQRIAWRSTSGPMNTGVVTFDKIGEDRTRVRLQMDYRPESLAEKVGDAVGGVRMTARGNLQRFKQLVESRGAETGGWRGTVTQH